MRATTVVLVAAVATGLAACGSTAAPSTKSGAISDFTFAIVSPATSLDWASDCEIQTDGIIDSLVTQPLEALSSTNTFSPVLATSVSEPNETTLVYHLRSGVKFSNGKPLTAADVVWSIEHYAKGSCTSTEMPQLKSVTATGPLTVTVNLPAPNPEARPEIALNAYVQNADFGEAHKKDLGTASAIPVGTGPYITTSYSTSSITLVRNDHYWGKEPSIKTLTFPVIQQDDSRELAFRSGSIDASSITDLKTLSTWKTLANTHTYIEQTSSEDFLGFDVDSSPFNDVHVRQAIAYAISPDALAQAGFDNNVSHLSGGFVPAYELSDVAGSLANAQSFLASLPAYTHNLATAKAQMKLSSYPKGFSTSIWYIETLPWEETVVLGIQQELKQIGINVTAKPVSENLWFTDFFEGKLTGLNLATFFNAVNNDPSGLLTDVVGTAGKYSAGSENFSKFTSPTVENALKTINSDAPPATRWAATKVLMTQMAELEPYIPLWTEPDPIVISNSFTLTSPADFNLFNMANGNWVYGIKAK
ncbi:MAG: ABC transporter substrate-binding protein [Acidimicrobiales bacterium]